MLKKIREADSSAGPASLAAGRNRRLEIQFTPSPKKFWAKLATEAARAFLELSHVEI